MHIHCYQGEWGHNHKSSGITLEQSALNSRSSLARMTVERGFWTLERKTEVLIKIMWLSCYFNQWHHLGLLCPFKSTQFLWVTMENTSAMTMRSVMQDQTPPTVRLVVMVGHILGIHCVLHFYGHWFELKSCKKYTLIFVTCSPGLMCYDFYHLQLWGCSPVLVCVVKPYHCFGIFSLCITVLLCMFWNHLK